VVTRAVMASTIAATKPGIVNSLAAMSTGRPDSRRVDEVTGPIDDIKTPSSIERNFGFRRTPSNSTKFLTVEELVKVTTCGLFFGFLNAAWRRLRELWGTTVS